MDDLKEVIAENLIKLRQEAGLTQLQLADMLNYSDKAVSKWERGESIPDLRILIRLAEIYHITVDDMVRAHPEKEVKPKVNLKKKRMLISILSAGLVWLVATGVFMIIYLTSVHGFAYLSYVIAPLVSFIVLMVFATMWASRLIIALTASGIIWSSMLIVHVFLRLYAPGVKVWPFYVVAVAVELLVTGWFILRKLYKPNLNK